MLISIDTLKQKLLFKKKIKKRFLQKESLNIILFYYKNFFYYTKTLLQTLIFDFKESVNFLKYFPLLDLLLLRSFTLIKLLDLNIPLLLSLNQLFRLKVKSSFLIL